MIHLLTDPDEINTAYVKLKKKILFFVHENVLIFDIVFEKIMISMFFGGLLFEISKEEYYC